MFMLDVEGRFATHDVIGQVKDLLEGKAGLVGPGAVFTNMLCGICVEMYCSDKCVPLRSRLQHVCGTSK
jgi:hypothetical protein